jgi:hypothetical protein
VSKKAGVITIDLDAGTAKFIQQLNAANAKVKDFGDRTAAGGGKLIEFGKSAKQAGEHTVSSMAASSAAIRLLENPLHGSIRAAERFITMLPGMSKLLAAGFPIIGAVVLGEMLVKLGAEAYNFFKTIEQAPEKISGAWRELQAPLKLTNDELALANDRLKNDIAALEHKPKNALAETLDEARVAADKLAIALDGDLKSLGKLLEENKSSFLQNMVKNQSGTEDIRKELVGETGSGGFRARVAGLNGDPKAAMAAYDEEIAKLETWRQNARAGQYAREAGQRGAPRQDQSNRIEMLGEVVRNLQAERRRIELEQQNTALQQQKSRLEATKANTKEEETALRDSYNRMLADMEAVQEMMTSEKLEFRQNELNEIQQYGGKYKELEKELGREIGALSQESMREYRKAEEEDAKEEQRFREQQAAEQVEWMRRQREAGKVTPENAEFLSREGEALNNPNRRSVAGQRADIERAGYASVQVREQAIARQQELLEIMQRGGYTLGQELAVRERILEDQIELNREQGKSTSAQEQELYRLRVQRGLNNMRSAGVSSVYGDVRGAFASAPGSVGRALAGGLMGDGKSIGADIRGALKDIGKQMMGNVFDHLVTMILGNTLATSANTVATWASAALHWLGFADGGRPPVGVPSIVGERGAELFVPDQAGTIIPNHELRSAVLNPSRDVFSVPSPSKSNSFGNQTFHFTINGANSPRETARAVADYLKSSSAGFSPAWSGR